MTQFATNLRSIKTECDNVLHQKSVSGNALDNLNVLSQFQSLSPTKVGNSKNESLHNQSKSKFMRRKCNITKTLPLCRVCRLKSPSNAHTHQYGSKCLYYRSSQETTTKRQNNDANLKVTPKTTCCQICFTKPVRNK